MCSSSARRGFKWAWRLLILATGGGAVVVLLHLGETLAAPAESPGPPADLLVILGGGIGDRVVKAAELLNRGQANQVLVTGVWPDQPIDRFKSYDYRIEYLETRGFTRDRIYLDATAETTWEEALLVHQFMREHHLNSVILVSDPPHMWRLAWVYRKVFGQSMTPRYRLVASEPPWWNSQRWWNNVHSSVFVLKEIIKITYYWLRYECEN
ncbi:YdcF family protein [Methylomagnum sp.]